MKHNSEKMSGINRLIVERRSGKDRRKIFMHNHFFFRRSDKKNLTERRLQEERRDGWVRINKWASVYLWDLKIARFLK
jgi:hypothetical protein